MARINTEQLRNWQNGDIIPASDYNQERNLIITAQNDTNDKANSATQDALNAVNRLSELSIQPTEVDKTSVVQSFTQTLTQGQTSVTLPSEYLPNTNRLHVFIDGAFTLVTESSNTGFTLKAPASEGQLLVAYWFTELPRVLDIERVEEAIENSRTEFLSPIKSLSELPNPTTDGWHIFVQDEQKVYRRQYGQWVAIYGVPQYVGDTLVSRAYHKETPTTQKTVFTLPNHYLPDNNRIDVYLSGVKQRSGVDYTETSTNKVTFQTPVAAGTNVEFVYFSQPQALAEDYFAQAKLAEQATIAANAAAQVANASALNRKEPVSTYSALLATPAVKYDARMVRDTGKVYRYDGSQWKLIEEIDATVINEVDSRLTSQLADIANQKANQSQVNELASDKADKTYVDQNLNTLSLKTVKYQDTGVLDLNVFDEPTRAAIQGIEPGTINAVLGKGNVKPENLSFMPVFGEVGKNLFDKTQVTHDYYVNHETGELVVNNNKTFAISDFIAVTPQKTYTRKFPQRLAFYDANKVFISGEFDDLTITTPPNAAFVRFDVLKVNLDAEQFEEGEISTEYEAFGYFLGSNLLPNVVQDKHLSERYVKGVPKKNLFDKSRLTLGYYINHETGEIVKNASATFAITDYIEIQGNTTYTRKFQERLAFYDQNKKYLSGRHSTEPYKTFVTPENAVFVRFDVRVENIDLEQLEKGSVSTDYEPFLLVPEHSSSSIEDFLTTQNSNWEV